MGREWLAGAAALLFSLAATPFWRAVWQRMVPGQAPPRAGGPAVAAGWLGAWMVAGGLASEPAVLISGLALLAVGVMDDTRGLRAWPKLAAQTAAVLPVCFADAAGTLEGLVGLGWVLAVVNAFNFIDGLDGLAAGLGVLAATGAAAIASREGGVEPVYAAALAGALLGFLPYNWRPASVYLGDAGSLFSGYVLAVLTKPGGGNGIGFGAGTLLLAIPLADLVWAVVRRLWRGRPVLAGDREHLHHVLDRRGRGAVLLLWAAGAVLAGAAVLSAGRG